MFLRVFLVACALRVLHIVLIGGTPLYEWPHGDGRVYLEWADAIRAQGVLGSDEVYYQAPLYPHLLALLRGVFGESLNVIRGFQALLGALTAALIACTGARLFGRRAGLAAGLLIALYPTSIWLDGLIQKSALTGVLVAGAMLIATYESTRARAGLGALLGLLMLTRGEARLIVVAFVAFFAVQRRWRAGGALLVGLAIALTPALLRNGLVAAEWTLTTSQSGPNLFIGNSPMSRGAYAPLVPGRGDARFEAVDARRIAEGAGGRALSASEVSNYWTQRAFDLATKDPAAATARLARKAALAVNNVEIADTDDLGHARDASFVLWIPITFGLLLIPAVLGATTLSVEERKRGRVLCLFVLGQWAALTLFYVFARYRLPIALGLAPLAGVAIVRWRALLETRGRTLGLAAATGALAWLPLIDASAGRIAGLVNEATALVERDDDVGAERVAQKALSLAGQDVYDARRIMGRALMAQGRSQDALPHLERCYVIYSGDWQVRAWLGIARGETGDLEGAYSVLRSAAIERPEALPIVSNAVALAMQLRRPGDAAQLLEARLEKEANEGAIPFRLQLAWIRSTAADAALRDGAQAVELVRDLEDSANVLSVRAAALAESGDFAAAIDAIDSAIEQTARAGNGNGVRVQRMQSQAGAFRAGRPWRE